MHQTNHLKSASAKIRAARQVEELQSGHCEDVKVPLSKKDPNLRLCTTTKESFYNKPQKGQVRINDDVLFETLELNPNLGRNKQDLRFPHPALSNLRHNNDADSIGTGPYGGLI